MNKFKKTPLPENAIIAVTLNCNSRCVMCDIWKNSIQKELSPETYLNLPSSLKDINITGGEPFLRKDLPEIIKNIKTACPKARLLINTNGFLTDVIVKQTKAILSIDPKIAIRVSIDGKPITHDKIRNIPHAYTKATKTLSVLKQIGVKDLGVSYTLMEQNYNDLKFIYKFCRQNQIELSLTLVSSSQIYFGQNKESLRPGNNFLIKSLAPVISGLYSNLAPKDWFRAWFTQKLLKYAKSGHRQLKCDAGNNFFYLNSTGDIFPCHLQNWPIGNIKDKTFISVWNSSTRTKCVNQASHCNNCWQICTAKTGIKKNIVSIAGEIIVTKLFRSLGIKKYI